MDIYVFAQHQPFSSLFAYVLNKISDTMSAYAQHYGITSTGSQQKSICHKHNVTSQACASSHLFHPTARLIQFAQHSPCQLVFMVHYCYYPYQICTNETDVNSKSYDTKRSQVRPKPWLTLFATSSLAHLVSQCHCSFI